MVSKTSYTITLPDALSAHPRATMHAERVARAIHDAFEEGFVIESTMQPRTPLAQGNYSPHVVLREVKDAGLRREALLKQWDTLGKSNGLKS